jgi:capsular exopolysaccharide synthesis family protein
VDQVVKAPMSFYAEAMRRLRASIDQTLLRTGSIADGATVVMVASTIPAEGKTTTSISLARTYAISGKRTLLIDCDLRKPSISRTLGLSGKTGLLDYLVATPDAPVELADIMALDPITDLEIIPSMGRSNRPTDQLLTSRAFTELMAAVRDHYDVIVLDTPPMLPVVDGRYLAHHADAIALVIKWATRATTPMVATGRSEARNLQPDIVPPPQAARIPCAPDRGAGTIRQGGRDAASRCRVSRFTAIGVPACSARSGSAVILTIR